MMRPKTISFAPTTPSVNGICLSQTPAGAGALLLNGALASALPGVGALNQVLLNAAYKIDFTSAGAVGQSLTVTGTDADGKAQVEVIAGPNANTVTTIGYFKSITSIAIAGAAGAALTSGINAAGQFISQTVSLDLYESDTTIAVDISGTINYDVQKAFERPTAGETPNWVAGGLSTQTADANSSYTTPTGAVRLKVNSYSAGATAKLQIIQGRSHL